ncbi:MAG: hypothetical protein ACOY90_02520 [Candidatus Zhuqueibacterota bacterium]
MKNRICIVVIFVIVLLISENILGQANNPSNIKKFMLGPSFSIFVPYKGDDTDKYVALKKFGFSFAYQVNSKYIIDFSFFKSTLKSDEKLVRQAGDIDADADFEKLETTGGSISQFNFGLRYLFPPKDKLIPYLRASVGYHNRKGITQANYYAIVPVPEGSYGYEKTYWGTIKFQDEGSTICTSLGGGGMVQVHEKIVLDLQINGHFYHYSGGTRMWMEPTVGLNLFL